MEMRMNLISGFKTEKGVESKQLDVCTAPES